MNATTSIIAARAVSICILFHYHSSNLDGSPPQALFASRGTNPVISYFNADPTTILQGQVCYLRWTTRRAGTVEIEGLGRVPKKGKFELTPASTTTYTLFAINSRGRTSASVTVTVEKPNMRSKIETDPRDSKTLSQVIKQLRDVHFDMRGELLEKEWISLQADATLLQKALKAGSPSTVIVIEGHSDLRRSAEFGLAIANGYASKVRDALVMLGVPAGRLQTISYGQESPICAESIDACAEQNRRVHLSSSD